MATAQNLRSAIKVWSYLFKLIVKSRQIQREEEEETQITASHSETLFRDDIKALLESINAMMAVTQPHSLIGTQSMHLVFRPYNGY